MPLRCCRRSRTRSNACWADSDEAFMGRGRSILRPYWRSHTLMSVEAPAQARPATVALPVVHSELVRRQTRLAWWLLLPSLLVVALVALVPLAQTFLASFTNERLASNRPVQ